MTTREVRARLSEDWLAVWLGFALVVLVVLGVRPEMPKFRWGTDGWFASTSAARAPAVAALVTDAGAKGDRQLAAAATALQSALGRGDRALRSVRRERCPCGRGAFARRGVGGGRR